MMTKVEFEKSKHPQKNQVVNRNIPWIRIFVFTKTKPGRFCGGENSPPHGSSTDLLAMDLAGWLLEGRFSGRDPGEHRILEESDMGVSKK